MLQNRTRWLSEIIHQGHCCINVQKIIVGNFFAVQLVKQLFELAVKYSSLMRVFSITQNFCIGHALLEGKNSPPAPQRGDLAFAQAKPLLWRGWGGYIK